MEKLKTFQSHLKELLSKAFIVFIIFGLLFVLFFSISRTIINFMLHYYGIVAYSLSPIEGISAQMDVGLILAGVFILPIITYQLYKFIRPSFNKLPRFIEFIIASEILGLIGFLFGILVFAKYIMGVLVGYSIGNPIWGITSIIKTSMAFGLSFALSIQIILIVPLVIGIGLIKRESFTGKFRYLTFLIILIIAGLIMPPDPFSMMLLTIPTYGSFEIGLLLSKLNLFGRSKCLVE